MEEIVNGGFCWINATICHIFDSSHGCYYETMVSNAKETG